MKKITWFVLFAIIAISCLNEPDCYQLDNSEIIVNFNVLGFAADPDTLLDVRTSGTDSVFYQNTIRSSFKLPLNPNTKEQAYIFRWKNGSIDTLFLGYSAQAQFVSADCGARYVFGRLFLPLQSSFDSLRIFNQTPTQPASANIVVYRCANPDRIGMKFKKGTTKTDSALIVSVVTTDFGKQITYNDSISSFFLPLNKKANTTTFEFTLGGGAMENLQLSYSRVTSASPVKDCDSVTTFSKIRIASTSFDTTATKIINTGSTGSVSTSTKDPAIINLEIFL